MSLEKYRSRVQMNLTREFVDKYGIQPDMIDSVINDYYVQCAFETKTIRNNYQLTLVANQASYPLDKEFMLITRVHYDYDSTSGSGDYGDELKEVSPNEYEGEMEYGAPEYYWLEQPHDRSNASIWFYKIPGTNETGKIIRVHSIKYPELMVSDSEMSKLQKIFDLIIIQGATKELGAIGEGIPRLSYFERNYAVNLEKARIMLSEPSDNRNYRVAYRDLL